MQLISYAVIAVLTGNLLTTASLGQETETQHQQPKVFVAKADPHTFYETKHFGGFIRANSESPAVSGVSGTVEKIFVFPGQKVKLDQALYRVKPRPTGGVLQAHIVRSPLSGTVALLEKDVGSYIDIGESAIIVADTTKLKVNFQASTQDLNFLKRGKKVHILNADLKSPQSATIQFASPAADKKTGTHHVSATLDCKVCPSALSLGRFVRIEHRINKRTNLAVPTRALRDKNSAVYTVTNDGTLKIREVQTGQSSGLLTEIKSGLEPGATVVVESTTQLTPGTIVTITSEQVELEKLRSEP